MLECTFTDASTDTDGTIVSYAWDFGDGATSTEADPVHSYATEGVVTVELTVTDNLGATSSVTGTVNPVAPNVPPTADFSYVCDDLECTFTDTSTDTDGTIVSHAWTFGDGATSDLADPIHTFSVAGTYTVELTVTDNETGEGFTSPELNVEITPNVDPTASFTYVCDDFECTFTDTSTDTDGTIVSHAWTFGDGATSDLADPIHTFGGAGTYTVELTVTDNETGEGFTSQEVTVAIATNVDPTASFTTSCNNLACSFDAGGSTDSDGEIVSYDWNFGDGDTSTGVTAGHTFAAGPVTVILTVTDNEDATGTSTQSFTVAPNLPPVAAFTPNCDGLVCEFDAISSSDTDGTIVSYDWTFGDGDTDTGATPANNYLFPGSYDVTLTVTDDDGATNVAELTMPVDLPVVATSTSARRTAAPTCRGSPPARSPTSSTSATVCSSSARSRRSRNNTSTNTTTYNQRYVASYNMNTGLVDTNFRPTFDSQR